MDILSEIKQNTPFADKRDEIIINLRFTVNFISKHYAKGFKKHGLTSQQYNILRIVSGSKDPLSTHQISERMVESMSDVPRLINRLVNKKLIKKIKRKDDKRKVNITITKQGSDLLVKLATVLDDLREVVNLNDSEMKTLSKLLDKLRGKGSIHFGTI